MGLSLSITNSLKGSPLFKGLPEQVMGFFHRFSAFIANWIRIKCVTFSNENGFADRGSPPPPPNGWDSQMVTPFLQEISGLRNNGEFFAYSSGQSYEEHQSTKGSWFPFASRSLEAPGRERPQPTPGILEISMTDVLTCTLTLNSGCSSLHINFVDVFFFIESLFSWCCPTWPSSSNAASIPVQAVLDPFYMTARVK